MSPPRRVTAGVVSGLALLAGLVGTVTSPADPLVVAAMVAVAALFAAAAGSLPFPRSARPQGVRVPVAALRERARRRTVPRLCDPDARGRSRPRAPSGHPSAA